AYSIIKNHDGYIGVESEVGVGTKFYLYLPASAERRQVGMNLKEAPASGKGRILIKDDEEIVREFLGEVLDQLGYEVELTKDGAEAIDLYRRAKENNRAFDAVIMDLTVPTGMGGKEIVIRLLEIDDKVKVIASSGYSNDSVMSDFKKYGFRGAVAKPYNLEELIRALSKVLNGE
ncbi:MAG TPA: response regulator, partial [Thermodesulfobacteriota bacterium]|nr:response regulator [Thermodesulfobacteriota bacterium]